jgi:hypothetical protein
MQFQSNGMPNIQYQQHNASRQYAPSYAPSFGRSAGCPEKDSFDRCFYAVTQKPGVLPSRACYRQLQDLDRCAAR